MNVNVKNYKLQNINLKKFLLRHNLDELGRLDMSTVDQSEILDVWGSETCQDFIGQLLGIELYHVIQKVLCYSTENTNIDCVEFQFICVKINAIVNCFY